MISVYLFYYYTFSISVCRSSKCKTSFTNNKCTSRNSKINSSFITNYSIYLSLQVISTFSKNFLTNTRIFSISKTLFKESSPDWQNTLQPYSPKASRKTSADKRKSASAFFIMIAPEPLARSRSRPPFCDGSVVTGILPFRHHSFGWLYRVFQE